MQGTSIYLKGCGKPWVNDKPPKQRSWISKIHEDSCQHLSTLLSLQSTLSPLLSLSTTLSETALSNWFWNCSLSLSNILIQIHKIGKKKDSNQSRGNRWKLHGKHCNWITESSSPVLINFSSTFHKLYYSLFCFILGEVDCRLLLELDLFVEF